MGKRLVIKGADFSQVAASVETMLNPLSILACGQGGTWINSYMDSAPNGSYCLLSNSGGLFLKTNGSMEPTTMPAENDSVIYYGAVLLKPEGETRYDVAFPENYEIITGWDANHMYNYNASQSTQPTKTAYGGVKCVQVHLNQGDVLVANIIGGDNARAVWVMKTDYSSTIKIAQNGSRADYAPICYEATENCEVFLNDTGKTQRTSYILRK